VLLPVPEFGYHEKVKVCKPCSEFRKMTLGQADAAEENANSSSAAAADDD
jgi:hypothetical protein